MFSTNFREGMTFPNLKLNGANDWNRYINIYKNLMRDVKRYFGEQYKKFIDRNGLNTSNKLLKVQFMPLFIKLFVDNHFDSNLKEFITNSQFQFESNLCEPEPKVIESNLTKTLTYEGFCFELASLILPKQVIETV